VNDTDYYANTPAPPPEPMSAADVTAWLDYSLAELIERRTTLIDGLIEMIADHPEIEETDARTAGVFAENLKMAKALETAALAQIEKTKRPFWDAGKAVDGWRNRYFAPLTDATTKARAVLLDLEQRKAATARRFAEKQAQEAARRAAEAAAAAEAAKAREGLFTPVTDVYEEQRRIAEQEAAKAAQIAQAKPAVLSHTHGHYGARASITTRWTWKVADISKVPLSFLQVNEDMLDAAAKKRDPVTGKPTTDVPGIEWVPQYNLGVR